MEEFKTMTDDGWRMTEESKNYDCLESAINFRINEKLCNKRNPQSSVIRHRCSFT
jgi:hypothetical protein